MSLGLLPHVQKCPYCQVKPSLDSWDVHRNKIGVLTSLNKQKFLMSTPTVTREHKPASRCNLRKSIRLPACWRWGPIPLHCVQSNSLFPIKQVRSLDLPERTTESPREIPQKSRRTLMLLQEYEIPRGSPNQLNIKPNYRALAPEQFPVPHHTRQVAWLLLGNYQNFLRHTSSVYRNTNFSTGIRGKLHAPHIVPRGELITGLYWTGKATLNKHLKSSLPSAIGMWEAPWVFCL